MKNIQEIIMCVTLNGMSNRELFSHFPDPNSLQHRFVLGVVDKTFISDEEAIETFYGENTKSSNAKYRKLKHDVREKLLTLLFVMPDEEGAINEYRNARTKASKLSALTGILFSNSALVAGEEVALQCIQLSEKYELYDILIYVLSLLTKRYTDNGNKEKREYYKRKLINVRDMYDAELEAVELFEHFTIVTSKTTTPGERDMVVGEQCCVELEVIAQRFPSFAIRNKALKARLYYSAIVRNFHAVIAVCQESLVMLEKQPQFATKTLYGTAYIQTANSYYELHQYDKGRIAILDTYQYFRPLTVNWGTCLLYDLLILLRLEDHSNAITTLLEAQKYISGGGTKEFWREQIQLIHGYFAYLVKYSGADVDENTRNLASQFSINEFMLSTPELSKDKSGAYITKYVLELMFMIRENPDGAVTRIESVRNLRKKHARGKWHSRTSAFLSLLECYLENFCTLPQTPVTTRLLKALEPSEKNFHGASESMEPIEYRRLAQLLFI
jgi:hypothetical protein